MNKEAKLLEDVDRYMKNTPSPAKGDEISPGNYITWVGDNIEDFWKHMDEVCEN